MVGVMVMRWAFLALGIGGHWFIGASRTCMGTTIPFHDWRAATNRRELVHKSRCEREQEEPWTAADLHERGSMQGLGGRSKRERKL
jgi:hypothetical protein